MLSRDHPRVCGEHRVLAAVLAMIEGSSPRMRGTQSTSSKSDHCRGIIPAYAGNTFPVKLIEWPKRDHPRVCGEHVSAISLAVRLTGSSPRMRGTLRLRCCPLPSIGIIPAYAGNTSSLISRPPLTRDHPRVCGEHTRKPSSTATPPGSSPRMRGTRSGVVWMLVCDGIIPAYAGNTRTPLATVTSSRDHPRVCGEHSAVFYFPFGLQGSSPRMRGTPSSGSAQYTWQVDHPRVCGEHPSFFSTTYL